MVVSAGVSMSLFVAEKRLDLAAVARPDLVTPLIEQFEHGERLLGRPQGRDGDGSRPERCGRRRRFGRSGHGLAPRRWRGGRPGGFGGPLGGGGGASMGGGSGGWGG